jgi:hypothetical protein
MSGTWDSGNILQNKTLLAGFRLSIPLHRIAHAYVDFDAFALDSLTGSLYNSSVLLYNGIC